MTESLSLLRSGVIQPPEAMRNSLDLIKRLILNGEVGRVDEAWTRVSDGSDSLISILGQRGSGKTTLLLAACSELERTESALILPLIRPEVFEATDSLLLAVLIEVEQWLSSTILKASPTDAPPASDSDVATALSSAIRSASISSEGAFQALASANESSGQYGVDATSLVRHRSRLQRALEVLFLELRKEVRLASDFPVVVPIDDVDLSPANLESVMAAVRMLAAVPQVYPIICADPHQLDVATGAAIRRQYAGAISDADADRLAAQVLAKSLRPERAVSPPLIPADDRSHFVPLGAEESVEEVLSTVGADRCLAALLWSHTKNSYGLEPRDMNGWLGETPRELEYFWEAASVLRQAVELQDHALFQHALQRLVDNIIGVSREFRVRVDVESAPWTRVPRASDQPRMALKWPSLVFGISTIGRFTSAATTPHLRLQVRRFASVTAAVFRDGQKDLEEDGRAREPLSSAAVSAATALQELSISGLLGGDRNPGSTYIGEKEFEFLQTARINGELTDDRFLFMPDSVGVQAIGRSAVAWNALVDSARSANRAHDAGSAQLAIRRLLLLVNQYWLQGDDKCLRRRRLPSMERLMRDASLLYLSRVRDNDVSHLDDYSLDAAYCSWFERRLPHAFHNLLLGSKRTEPVVGQWLDAISAGPRAVEATSEVRSALEARFASMIDEQRRRQDGANSWVYGYQVIAQAVGTELYADLLMFKTPYEERLRSRRVGGDLLGGSISLSTTKGSYDFAPHRTVEGDEEMAVLREVLDQYRDR